MNFIMVRYAINKKGNQCMNFKMLCAMLLTGCASLINESTQIITVGTLTPMEETWCHLKNEEGYWSTPANHAVTIKRDGNPMLVTCENERRIGETTVSPSFRTGFLMADIFLIDYCTISCIIDGANNAFYDYPIDIIVPMRYKDEFLIN